MKIHCGFPRHAKRRRRGPPIKLATAAAINFVLLISNYPTSWARSSLPGKESTAIRISNSSQADETESIQSNTTVIRKEDTLKQLLLSRLFEQSPPPSLAAELLEPQSSTWGPNSTLESPDWTTGEPLIGLESGPPTGATNVRSASKLLLLFALLILINLIVILGNILVILAVYATAKLRSVTNIFIVSLATADLLLGVFVLPYAMLLEVLDVWVFGPLWCHGWLVTDVWISTASILNLCAISIDRYVAVTRPVKYRSIMTPRRAKTIVAGVWVVSFLICFPPLLPNWNTSAPIPQLGAGALEALSSPAPERSLERHRRQLSGVEQAAIALSPPPLAPAPTGTELFSADRKRRRRRTTGKLAQAMMAGATTTTTRRNENNGDDIKSTLLVVHCVDGLATESLAQLRGCHQSEALANGASPAVSERRASGGKKAAKLSAEGATLVSDSMEIVPPTTVDDDNKADNNLLASRQRDMIARPAHNGPSPTTPQAANNRSCRPPITIIDNKPASTQGIGGEEARRQDDATFEAPTRPPRADLMVASKPEAGEAFKRLARFIVSGCCCQCLPSAKQWAATKSPAVASSNESLRGDSSDDTTLPELGTETESEAEPATLAALARDNGVFNRNGQSDTKTTSSTEAQSLRRSQGPVEKLGQKVKVEVASSKTSPLEQENSSLLSSAWSYYSLLSTLLSSQANANENAEAKLWNCTPEENFTTTTKCRQSIKCNHCRARMISMMTLMNDRNLSVRAIRDDGGDIGHWLVDCLLGPRAACAQSTALDILLVDEQSRGKLAVLAANFISSHGLKLAPDLEANRGNQTQSGSNSPKPKRASNNRNNSATMRLRFLERPGGEWISAEGASQRFVVGRARRGAGDQDIDYDGGRIQRRRRRKPATLTTASSLARPPGEPPAGGATRSATNGRRGRLSKRICRDILSSPSSPQRLFDSDADLRLKERASGPANGDANSPTDNKSDFQPDRRAAPEQRINLAYHGPLRLLLAAKMGYCDPGETSDKRLVGAKFSGKSPSSETRTRTTTTTIRPAAEPATLSRDHPQTRFQWQLSANEVQPASNLMGGRRLTRTRRQTISASDEKTTRRQVNDTAMLTKSDEANFVTAATPQRNSRESSGCALFHDKPYVIYSALGSFYIPMLIMIFFYSRIYLVASRAHKAVQRGYMTTKWPVGSGSSKKGTASNRCSGLVTDWAGSVHGGSRKAGSSNEASNPSASTCNGINCSHRPLDGTTGEPIGKSAVGGPGPGCRGVSTSAGSSGYGTGGAERVTLRIHRREKGPPPSTDNSPAPGADQRQQQQAKGANLANFELSDEFRPKGKASNGSHYWALVSAVARGHRQGGAGLSTATQESPAPPRKSSEPKAAEDEPASSDMGANKQFALLRLTAIEQKQRSAQVVANQRDESLVSPANMRAYQQSAKSEPPAAERSGALHPQIAQAGNGESKFIQVNLPETIDDRTELSAVWLATKGNNVDEYCDINLKATEPGSKHAAQLCAHHHPHRHHKHYRHHHHHNSGFKLSDGSGMASRHGQGEHHERHRPSKHHHHHHHHHHYTPPMRRPSMVAAECSLAPKLSHWKSAKSAGINGGQEDTRAPRDDNARTGVKQRKAISPSGTREARCQFPSGERSNSAVQITVSQYDSSSTAGSHLEMAQAPEVVIQVADPTSQEVTAATTITFEPDSNPRAAHNCAIDDGNSDLSASLAADESFTTSRSCGVLYLAGSENQKMQTSQDKDRWKPAVRCPSEGKSQFELAKYDRSHSVDVTCPESKQSRPNARLSSVTIAGSDEVAAAELLQSESDGLGGCEERRLPASGRVDRSYSYGPTQHAMPSIVVNWSPNGQRVCSELAHEAATCAAAALKISRASSSATCNLDDQSSGGRVTVAKESNLAKNSPTHQRPPSMDASTASGLSLMASLPQAANQVRKQSMMLLSTITSRGSQTLRRLSMVANPVSSLLARSKSRDSGDDDEDTSDGCITDHDLVGGVASRDGTRAAARSKKRKQERRYKHRKSKSRSSTPNAHKRTLDDYLLTVAGIDGSSDEDDYGDEDDGRSYDDEDDSLDDNLQEPSMNYSLLLAGNIGENLLIPNINIVPEGCRNACDFAASSSTLAVLESGSPEKADDALQSSRKKSDCGSSSIRFLPSTSATTAAARKLSSPGSLSTGDDKPARLNGNIIVNPLEVMRDKPTDTGLMPPSSPGGLQRRGGYYERATSRSSGDARLHNSNSSINKPAHSGPPTIRFKTTGSSGHSNLASNGSGAAAKGSAGNVAGASPAPQRRRGAKRTSRWHAKRLRAETKAAKTVAIIIGGFIFCWLPFFTAYLSRAIICERPDCIPQSLLSLFIWLGYLNSAINPVIYGLFSADFRYAFKNILCKCKFRNTDDTAVVSVLVDSIIKSIL